MPAWFQPISDFAISVGEKFGAPAFFAIAYTVLLTMGSRYILDRDERQHQREIDRISEEKKQLFEMLAHQMHDAAMLNALRPGEAEDE